MKVLVTGAPGLLGSNIVRVLVNRKIETRILIRENSSRLSLEGLNLEEYAGDVTDPEALICASKGCDAIIHAAANTNQVPTGFKYYYPVNVKGTENVVNAARINRIQKLIHVSTVNAFGYGSRQHPGTELSEFNMFRFNSGYVISKYISQQYVLTEAEKHGLPVVVVNPSFMLGPYDAKPSSGRLILMCLDKKIWFCPAGSKNFIDVRDTAEAICNAIGSGVNGECYLLTNENLRLSEFFSKVRKVAGIHQIQVDIPGAVTRVIGMGGSVIQRLTGKPIEMNNTNARLMGIKCYFSSKRAVEELGLRQTSIEKSIADALEWFRAHGFVNEVSVENKLPSVYRHFLGAHDLTLKAERISI